MVSYSFLLFPRLYLLYLRVSFMILIIFYSEMSFCFVFNHLSVFFWVSSGFGTTSSWLHTQCNDPTGADVMPAFPLLMTEANCPVHN